jgi:hypothetical protein
MAVKVEVGLEDLSAEKIVSQIFSKQAYKLLLT